MKKNLTKKLVITNNYIEIMKKVITYLFIALLAGFGLITLFLSSSIIFNWFGVRANQGNYVLFIIWVNFVSSLIYLASAYGLKNLKSFTYKLLSFSTVLLIIALIALFVYINRGGIYETKTIAAMFFRISITTLFTIFTYLRITKWRD